MISWLWPGQLADGKVIHRELSRRRAGFGEEVEFRTGCVEWGVLMGHVWSGGRSERGAGGIHGYMWSPWGGPQSDLP